MIDVGNDNMNVKVYGQFGDDTIYGNDGDDTMYKDDAIKVLYGKLFGNDKLIGGKEMIASQVMQEMIIS